MKTCNFIALAAIMAFLLPANLQAQELQCAVTVTAPTVSSDQSVYPQMQDAILKYVNFRKWTDLKFEPSERIKCRMMLIINTRPDVDRFTGTLQVQVIRPVYNSQYESMTFNIQDKDIDFKYVAFTPLEFSENNFIDELTSILNFYCYMIIGWDAETYELGSGAPYFQKAQTIVNLGANGGGGGWHNYDGTRNRYWLVNDMIDNAMKPVHNILYVYHRQGLDQMEKNLPTARGAILGALRELQKLNQRYPAKYFTRVVITAKIYEIIDIFRKANMTEKAEMLRIMAEVDPANANDYQKVNTEK